MKRPDGVTVMAFGLLAIAFILVMLAAPISLAVGPIMFSEASAMG